MAKTYLGKLGEAPVVMLIGPVAYWWDTDDYKHWDLAEHWHYVAWRERLNDALIESGFLVYRHWEAFKGTWNNKMQEVNNYVLERSDFVVNMTPEYAWSEGVDEELDFADSKSMEVISAPPPRTEEEFSWAIKNLLEQLKERLDR
jgi:hypothetical protein